jgi:hypothetical protein
LVASRTSDGRKIEREHVTFDYVNSKRFQVYLGNYIEFLKEFGEQFDFYVSLDIIMSAELSWDVQKTIESEGLNPLPVFHLNEPWKYWERYIDQYEYVGLGGLGQDIPVERFRPFGDKAFKYIWDKKGPPRVKVHGFAVNSTAVLLRYPYYSVDASSWTAFARNGVVCIPVPKWSHRKIVGYDYLKPPYSMPCGSRSLHKNKHLANQCDLSQKVAEEYIQSNGFTINDTEEYWVRDILNIKYYLGMEKAIKEIYEDRWGFGQGGNLYLAGQPSAASTLSSLKRVIAAFPEGINCLPSYYYRRHTEDLLRLKIPRRTFDGL